MADPQHMSKTTEARLGAKIIDDLPPALRQLALRELRTIQEWLVSMQVSAEPTISVDNPPVSKPAAISPSKAKTAPKAQPIAESPLTNEYATYEKPVVTYEKPIIKGRKQSTE